jgi:DNA-binding MltR family transcriptional regulator
MSKDRINLDEYKWEAFYEEIQKETPRASVIISGTFLDTLLGDLIASFMIEGDKVVDELLSNDHEAPLSNFGARIKTAYCLGLISKIEFNDLKIIQKIRNKFAHKLHGYSFDEREIVNWCNSLETPKSLIDVMPILGKSHSDKFLIAVSLLSTRLGIRILGVQKERRIRYA